MKIEIILAAISSLALAISLTTLWQSHLARFRPISVAGPLKLRIYRFEADGESWYIPQVDCQTTITNTGAQAGKVLGLRMVARYPLVSVPDAHEVFYGCSEVDTGPFREHESSRLEWLAQANPRDAAPFILLARSSATKHVVFDRRWDAPVVQGKIEFSLEMLASPRAKWVRVEKWEHRLDARTWSELAEVGTAITVAPVHAGTFGPFDPVPADLHTYTRGGEEIPAGGFRQPPSRAVAPDEGAGPAGGRTARTRRTVRRRRGGGGRR